MGETRMLVDGALVEAENRGDIQNINPATEDVIGVVADGTAADMQRAVDAARRAFDTTDWGQNRQLRRQGLIELQAALESEKEELRAEIVSEVGTPIILTYGPQLDAPLREALVWPTEMIDRFEWHRDLEARDARSAWECCPTDASSRSRRVLSASSCHGTSRWRSH